MQGFLRGSKRGKDRLLLWKKWKTCKTEKMRACQGLIYFFTVRQVSYITPGKDILPVSSYVCKCR